jgi:outer membrane protein TolC
MVDAGVATAFDVALFRLEEARERSRLVSASLVAANAGSDLSELLAVPVARLGELREDALPELPDEVPPMPALQELVVGEHAGLLRLRAQHEVAERRLHLEVMRQYPDLTIGTGFGGEPGERQTRLGLTFGITLPLFDRNQHAIAAAMREREAARVRYFSAVQDILTAVERAQLELALAIEHHRILRDEVVPAAEANLAIARVSVEAGSAGGLELLDAQRSLRQVQIEVLEALLGEHLAWGRLEQSVGYPLVRFTPAADEDTWHLSADRTDTRAKDGGNQ